MHYCRILGVDDTCTPLRIATTPKIDNQSYDQSHDAACSAADTDRKTRVQILKQNMQQHDDGKDTSVASDTKAKLSALGQELVRSTLLPIIRDLCVQRLSRMERYPMPGPAEPVDDGVETPEIQRRHPIGRQLALPTEQMIKYKQKLKAQGRE